MYATNKKDTFRPAHGRGYEPSRVLLILCLLCAINAALPSVCLAANHCIRDGGSGDGTAWNNALDDLPATLTRGDTYYIADGNYTGYTFDDAESGSTYIYIKKAIESDHGTDVGWQASYGDGVANWVMNLGNPVFRMQFFTSYYVFDGQVGGGPGSWDSGHGFKVYLESVEAEYRGLFIMGDNSTPAYNPHYITIKHVEMTAPNRDAGAFDLAICTYVKDSVPNSACNHHYYGYNYIHDIAYPFKTGYVRYWTVEYNYIARNDCQPPESNQGAGWEDYGSNDMIVRYNIWEDIEGTSAIDIKKNYHYDNSNWDIYGNVFWYTPDTEVYHGYGGPGVIGDAFSEDPPEACSTSNMKVYNNVFINLKGNNTGISFNAPTHENNEVYNNIWYSCTTVSHSNRGDNAIGHDNDYNAYINTPWSGAMPEPSPNDTVIPQDIDPFVDWVNGDFRLKSSTEPGLALTHPNDVKIDMTGITRGTDGVWDRGALEYVSDPNVHTHDLSVSSTTGGTVTNPGVGQFSYDHGSEVSIEAKADLNYHFVNWTGTAVDAGKVDNPSNASTKVTMDSDYTIHANFAINTYTLSMTAVNGSVTKTPDKASYSHGETVTLQAEPDTGYHFLSWSGDASGDSNSVTIVMNANKSVTANFAINTYMLNVTAVNGSVTKTPDKASYNYGEEVTLQAEPDTGYHFLSWSGDASGDSNSVAIVMNADKSVTANFAIDTYTLNITALNGSVTKTPNKATYNYSEEVTLQAEPDTGYHFLSWSGDASGDSNSVTIVMNTDKSVTANFAIDEVDGTAPAVTNLSPDPNDFMSDSVPLNSLILLDITDTGKGVDRNTVEIRINNDLIYDGDNETSAGVYDSTGHVQTIKGICRRIGSSAAYKYIFQPDEKFDYDQELSTAVNAADLATPPNTMSEYQYSLISEMRSFGEKKTLTAGKEIISSGANKDSERPLTTVSDSSGNVWVAWTEGDIDGDNNLINRDVFLGKIMPGTDSFESGGVFQVTNDAPDQANPVLAIDSSDNLYLVWQDERYGKWDLFISTSADGTTWTAEKLVTDPNYNQTNPAMAIDSSDQVYIVYDDDQNTDKDIYIASSADNFVSKTQISSAIYDQTTPDIAIDSFDTVYVVWTDTRNGEGKNNPKTDIYGAASNNSWTNIEIVDEDKEGKQTAPKIATEDTGTILHFVWVDDEPGDKEVYYGSSDGLPGTPLTGTNIIDTNLPTDVEQKQPAIAVTGYTGGTDDDVLKVFACWEDERYDGIENIHAVETTNLGTNIWVGDDGAGNDQKVPAIGIDPYNHPYLVWVNNKSDIIYTGSTFIESELASTNVSITSEATVGTSWNYIQGVDDVSVEVPQEAYLCDVEVTISRIRNPQKPPSNNRTFLYEFGPSGTTFSDSNPVTITIPYNATSLVSSPSAYWYNPLTGLYSQEGITDVEVIQISGLYALRFKTTHFSIFGGGGSFDDIFGGGGGGGGCSMSPNSQDSIAELLLPYIGLAVAMVVLKLRDRRKRKAHNITKSEC